MVLRPLRIRRLLTEEVPVRRSFLQSPLWRCVETITVKFNSYRCLVSKRLRRLKNVVVCLTLTRTCGFDIFTGHSGLTVTPVCGHNLPIVRFCAKTLVVVTWTWPVVWLFSWIPCQSESVKIFWIPWILYTPPEDCHEGESSVLLTFFSSARWPGTITQLWSTALSKSWLCDWP